MELRGLRGVGRILSRGGGVVLNVNFQKCSLCTDLFTNTSYRKCIQFAPPPRKKGAGGGGGDPPLPTPLGLAYNLTPHHTQASASAHVVTAKGGTKCPAPQTSHPEIEKGPNRAHTTESPTSGRQATSTTRESFGGVHTALSDRDDYWSRRLERTQEQGRWAGEVEER